MARFIKDCFQRKNNEIEVFYKEEKIEICGDIKRKSEKCVYNDNGYESFIEFTQFYYNQELNIHKLKVHELCRGKKIGLMLMAESIQSCKKPISKITIKACAEDERQNKYKDDSDYKPPRTQKELVEYYNNFEVFQNGERVKIYIEE